MTKARLWLSSEDGVVSSGELLVVVADQETRLEFAAVEFPHILPGLLSGPRAIGLRVTPARSTRRVPHSM